MVEDAEADGMRTRLEREGNGSRGNGETDDGGQRERWDRWRYSVTA
jgi:hypothetical protein